MRLRKKFQHITGDIMIHAIYTRSKPTHKWHLVSVALSQEIVSQDLDSLRKQAQLIGSYEQEAVVQTFDTAFNIPEYLTVIKERKLLYN